MVITFDVPSTVGAQAIDPRKVELGARRWVEESLRHRQRTALRAIGAGMPAPVLATNPEGARTALDALGLRTMTARAGDAVQIEGAARFLSIYAPEARESAANLAANVERAGYKLLLVERGSRAVGLLAGERFENGLAIIDYHTLLEAPRSRTETRAGRALLAPFLEAMKPHALFAETTDAKMRLAYAKIGFKAIAGPPPGARPGERLTMMVLPIADEAKQQMKMRAGRAELMKGLRESWYAGNWSCVEGDARFAPARIALERMEQAAAQGKLIWIQRLVGGAG